MEEEESSASDGFDLMMTTAALRTNTWFRLPPPFRLFCSNIRHRKQTGMPSKLLFEIV